MLRSTDRIERQIQINAPRARVWRALTAPAEFSRWFHVAVSGADFAAGQTVKGRATYPGYEHLKFEIIIERTEPERFMSWRWHPTAGEPGIDVSMEPYTLVVFELTEAEGGTLLRVVETGFDKLSRERRLRVFRLNSEGWEEQLQNVSVHVASS
jgi:uncharacterized protein YndB with AHSA1/START domain